MYTWEMSYSDDLKERVLAYVGQGGKKTEAVRLFGISRSVIYAWLSQPSDHRPRTPGPKGSYKFDREALRAGVQTFPDRLQKGWAEHFRVSINAISHALKRLGMVRKKRRYAMSKAFIKKRSGAAI